MNYSYHVIPLLVVPLVLFHWSPGSWLLVGPMVDVTCQHLRSEATKLKGLMRDPIFAKVAYRLKRQRHPVVLDSRVPC